MPSKPMATLTATEIHPLDDCIVVRPDSAEEKSKGGIYLPQVGDRPHATTGVVVAVGPGAYPDGMLTRRPLILEVGQRVLFPAYGPHDITLDGEELRCMRERDVLAVLA